MTQKKHIAPKTAVILAAGLGSRFKDRTHSHPKGFLELDGRSLIERSVQILIASGIERIIIGTGHLSHVYDEFANKYPIIECVFNRHYGTTGSMYTLQNMRQQIDADFLLLESDLLYETQAIETLLQDEGDDIILASGTTLSNDEVYIQTTAQSNLVNMSKDAQQLDTINAELVGISRIPLDRFKLMCAAFDDLQNDKIDYEYIMVETSKSRDFPVKKIDDLVWCEIDDENHLKRAVQEILPKLLAIKNQKNKGE